MPFCVDFRDVFQSFLEGVFSQSVQHYQFFKMRCMVFCGKLPGAGPSPLLQSTGNFIFYLTGLRGGPIGQFEHLGSHEFG